MNFVYFLLVYRFYSYNKRKIRPFFPSVLPFLLFTKACFYVPHLCGGAVVAIGDPHRHVVVGAPSGVESAGDGDDPRVPLDVKVLFFIAT